MGHGCTISCSMLDLNLEFRPQKGCWLDLIAADYFGLTVGRRIGENDDAYQTANPTELIRETRDTVAVYSVTCRSNWRSPVVFEPANTSDTGGYGDNNKPYGRSRLRNSSGGWGSLGLPFQCFCYSLSTGECRHWIRIWVGNVPAEDTVKVHWNMQASP